MSINSVPLLAASAGSNYQISRSVRLRASATAHFTRTLATPTSNTVWSWSSWSKLGQLGTTRPLFGGTGTNYGSFGFESTNQFRFWNNAGSGVATSTAVFRDPAAWYSVVVISNGTTIKAYINGSEVLSYTGTITNLNSAIAHQIGRFGGLAYYYDGYLSEINFIDGQALTPSAFGQIDPVTSVWAAKKYTGTYGTNGFYLNFADNSAATAAAIGKDSSGNGNNWTPNNISVAAGITHDSMLDVPLSTGGSERGNYCTLNPVDTGGGSVTLSGGNLNYAIASSAGSQVRGTVGTDFSSKWYWEFINGTTATATTPVTFGISTLDGPITNNSSALRLSAIIYTDGATNYFTQLYVNGSLTSTLTTQFRSAAIGDVFQVAYDAATGKLWFGKNNIWYDAANTTTGNPSAGTNQVYTLSTGNAMTPFLANLGASYSGSLNCGQRPFAYTPPTGFKALHTGNLPEPAITQGNKWMDATTYTGTGIARDVVNSGAMQPDLVWIKGRSGATDHALYDAVRGVQLDLVSSSTAVETTQATGLTAFNANGFSIGALAKLNTSTATYVAWQWKESATAGFDIVAYTGNAASARAIDHSLGVAPKMVIVKARSLAGENWNVWHTGLNNNAARILLNLTNVVDTASSTVWGTGGINPTSTTFQVGSSSGANGSGSTYVAYLFSEVAGFSRFGRYTGNGVVDGPFVFCGFRPAYVLVKSVSVAGNWIIWDTTRNTSNVTDKALFSNLNVAENSGVNIDTLSNGFKIRDTSTSDNQNAATYIYAAFAETPFKHSLAR